MNILSWFFSTTDEVTDEEVKYFREHPDEIDEVTAPLNIHKFFLLIGFLTGALCVALSKALKYFDIVGFAHEAIEEFFIDIIFEVGVALIGATLVAYVLVVVLNEQQENAKRWRAKLHARIRDDNLPKE